MAPEFAIGLMDQLGIQKAILVGHSAGGSVVLPTVNDGILLCLKPNFPLIRYLHLYIGFPKKYR